MSRIIIEIYIVPKQQNKIKMVKKLKQMNLGLLTLLLLALFSFASCEKEKTEDGDTKLEVTVYMEGSKTPISNCEVELFNNYEDWDNFDNEVGSKYTDNLGVVTFSNLSTKAYYVSVWLNDNNGFWHNWDEEDLNIKTGVLDKGVVNKYIVYARHNIGKNGEIDKTKLKVVRTEKVLEKEF